jgi:hypothetical protein
MSNKPSISTFEAQFQSLASKETGLVDRAFGQTKWDNGSLLQRAAAGYNDNHYS